MKTLAEILGLEKAVYTKTIAALFAYQFNRIDLDQFIGYVGDKKEGARIKDIARFSGYILKNCKLYAYAVHVARLASLPMPKAEAYKVHKDDARILRRLNLKHLPNTFRSFTLQEFDKLVNGVCQSPELKAYAGRFISKKMSFLMKSYGVQRSDIEAILQEAAITAVYKQYPRYESKLHFVNVAKASIHNVGHSFITHQTAKTRQQLSTNSDGSHEHVHVDLNAISDLHASPGYGELIRDSLLSLATLEARMSERVHRFILCLAGTFDAALSEYLKCDNSEAVDCMSYDRYMKKVQTFFQVTEEQTQNLFAKLRPHLA